MNRSAAARPPQLADVQAVLRQAGATPPLEARILRHWLQGLPQDAGRRALADFMPKTLRAALPGWSAWVDGLVQQEAGFEDAQDGARRLLLRLSDGQRLETVLLPKQGVCVSTQVGCAVGCRFCMTGTTGLIRQVGGAEILAQVVLAQRLHTVRKVVFMGMGEPAHNLDAVLDAITALGQWGQIGHKNLVFSTVGDPRVFERLAQQRVKPALALSLHTTRDALRRELLPRAPSMSVEALVHAGEQYARAVGYPIQYQWTLLDGVNDTPEEIDGIVRLLRGKYALMNFIPYNENSGMPWRRPAGSRAAALARELHQRGVLCKLRHSAGQAVEGGCGQLRARAGPVIPLQPV